jgi:hypothetical protein
LTEREYLVYVSSKRESNSSLISSREPRRLTGSDGNESLWFHYFEISSSTEWPETWKIGKSVLNPDAFKVLIASPIDAKPTNPDSVIISDSRPLVLAIRTSEENQQVEAQWWSGKKEWITDELIGDGWSRKNIIPNPDFHIDRLQFMQNHTFINRPYRPIDILYQKDYVPILDEQKIIQNPAIISIVEGRKVLEEVKLLSHSKPVEISSDDFTLSSEWLLIKLAPWKVNYRFVNEKNELGREGSGIDELNDRINRIQDSEQQWQSISIDWTSQSDRLACIPALELNYTGLTDSVEVEIEDVIDIYQEKPDSRSNFSREKLPNTIQEVSDLAKLTPINFTKRYVNLREDDLTKLRQWLADLLSWEREDIDYGLRQKLQGFWIADKTEYSTISLKCNFNDGKCTRKHKVTLQNYMDRGNLAAICRGKHNFGRRGRGS